MHNTGILGPIPIPIQYTQIKQQFQYNSNTNTNWRLKQFSHSLFLVSFNYPYFTFSFTLSSPIYFVFICTHDGLVMCVNPISRVWKIHFRVSVPNSFLHSHLGKASKQKTKIELEFSN